MLASERIDHLEAQLLAHNMVLRLLVAEAPASMSVQLARVALAVEARGLFQPLTDEQLSQIQRVLLAMRP